MTRAERRIYEAALRLFAERGVTQVTVSDLAAASGVARGTIYNNFASVETLFEDVATALTAEMSELTAAAAADTTDPAKRVAFGMRFFVRRAHEDPLWGRFLVRFGATTPTLQELLQGAPSDDVLLGVEGGVFRIRGDQVPSAVGLLSAGVLAAMSLVLEGRRTWRDAGSDVAELFLRALGVAADEAQAVATGELPVLSTGGRPG